MISKLIEEDRFARNCSFHQFLTMLNPKVCWSEWVWVKELSKNAKTHHSLTMNPLFTSFTDIRWGTTIESFFGLLWVKFSPW